MKSANRFLVLALGALASFSVLTQKSSAQTNNFIGPSWNEPQGWFHAPSWSLGIVPTSSRDVRIPGGSVPFLSLAHAPAAAQGISTGPGSTLLLASPANFVEHYNTVRLHSAIGYITPKLLGKEKAIFAARDKKLAQARRQRRIKRPNQPAHSVTPQPVFSI